VRILESADFQQTCNLVECQGACFGSSSFSPSTEQCPATTHPLTCTSYFLLRNEDAPSLGQSCCQSLWHICTSAGGGSGAMMHVSKGHHDEAWTQKAWSSCQNFLTSTAASLVNSSRPLLESRRLFMHRCNPPAFIQQGKSAPIELEGRVIKGEEADLSMLSHASVWDLSMQDEHLSCT